MGKILITNISWRRTYLFVEYTSKEPASFYLENKVGLKIPMESGFLGDDRYCAKLNLCIANKRELLPGGQYIFSAGVSSVEVDNNILKNTEEFSRVFRYSGGSYAYVVSFTVTAKDGHVQLIMLADYMMKNKKPKKRRPFFDGEGISGKIKRLALVTGIFFCNAYYFTVSLICQRGKNILFMSENRFKISENLTAIDTRIKERALNKEYKISYSFRNTFDKGYSPFSWIALVTKIAKSRYIFIDDYTPIFAYLRLRNTSLVQVWHAGFGFKLVGYGRFGISGSPHPFISCHRKYSYGIIGCEELREIYTEVWGIEKENLIASGMPRLEHFLDENIIAAEKDRLLTKYPVLTGKRVILFAPTYRGLDQKGAYYDFDKLDFGLLYNYAVKNNASVIFKMHHFIKERVPIPEKYSDCILEISDENINSLFYITDVLISDYSSCFYDYSLLKRPMLFYAYDKDYYFASRGVHLTLDEVAPGRICEDFDSLMDALENEDYKPRHSPGRIFLDRAVLKDGLASDVIIDNIIRR